MKTALRFLCLILLSAIGFSACTASTPSPSSEQSPTADKETGSSGLSTMSETSAPLPSTGSVSPTGSTLTAHESVEPVTTVTPTPEPTETPGPTPDCAPDEPPVSVTVGSVRVQLLSNTLVRIEGKEASGFEDRPSFSVPKRTGWKKVGYRIEKTDKEQIVVTNNYHVHIPDPSAGLSNVYITDPSGSELWRYEGLTTSNMYLPSPGDELSCWYFSDTPRVIPSEYGYSLPEEGAYEKNNGWTFSQTARDLFVFLPQGNYRTFASDFVKLTGRSEMVPLDTLGYWDSRWYAYSEETALKQIRDYKEKGYSIDVLVIDTDWRDTSNGVGYKINEKLFPNMARFLEEAHKEGVTIIFNDHPEPAKGTKNLLDEKEIEYRSKNLKLLLSLGLDYWWYDRNWSVALNPVTDGLSIYATGMYAFQWITEEYYASIANDLGTYARRGLIMGNVDGINNGVLTYAPELAAHRFSLQWTGDIDTDGYALEQEIYDAIYGGAELGLPYMSSDLGGHTSAVTKEMYVRWIQYGALSNFCRVHCTKPYSRMPWLYGEVAEAVTKEYVGMRYRLLPLFYALAHENYETGLPIMRRLDVNYPCCIEASANDEYLLGDYILIAPISGAQKADNVPDAWLTHDGQPGLAAEYYKNSKLNGTPEFTRVDSNIHFDWSNIGQKDLGIKENFSIRWTGEITAGEEDVMLRFYADDGVRVWIDGKRAVNGWGVYDTYLFTDVMKAGTTHSLKVEYNQLGGYAHIFMAYTAKLDDKRDVFLPEGEWIDVWSGERTVGPAVVTVDHPLETSPIYVRSGAIVALAEDTVNTKEKNWSSLALDVYPSKNYPASTVLYEDDGETVAYKDGKYRTTEIRMAYTDALTLDIGAAEGSFESDFRAFEERSYTVRLHMRSDFGDIAEITLDGKEIEPEIHPIDESASPFAYEGGARDGAVCEFTVRTNVHQAHQIKVRFEHPVDDRKNENYDQTAVQFSVKCEKIAKKALDLSKDAGLDFAYFGYESAGTVVRMKNGAGVVGELSSDGRISSFTDNYPVSFSGGDVIDSGSATTGCVSSRNFRITLGTTGEKTSYTLYIGGWKSLAKITVRDRSGNVRTLSFGDLNSNYYRKVTIECEDGEASELYINYSILCGENITFTAVQAANAD